MLTREQRRDVAVVPMFVALPLDGASSGNFHTLALHFFGRGEGSEGCTFPVDVEVFMKTVNKEIEKFFGVLLAVNDPFAIHAAAEISECGRFDDFAVSLPDSLN